MSPAKVGNVPRLPPWSYAGAPQSYPFATTLSPRSWAGRPLGGPDRYLWPLLWSPDSAARSYQTDRAGYEALVAGMGGAVVLPRGGSPGYALRRPRALVYQDSQWYGGQFGGPAGETPVQDAVVSRGDELAALGVFAGPINQPAWNLFWGWVPHQTTRQVVDAVPWGTYGSYLPVPEADKFAGGECLVIRVIFNGTENCYWAYTITGSFPNRVFTVGMLTRTMAQELEYLAACAALFDRFEVHVIHFWQNFYDGSAEQALQDLQAAFQGNFLRAMAQAPPFVTYTELGGQGAPGQNMPFPAQQIQAAALAKIQSFYGIN